MADHGPFLDATRVDVAARGHHGINFDFETWCGHNHRCVRERRNVNNQIFKNADFIKCLS